MTNVCVIPARGNSKGIINKNIRLLGGKPLIYYSMSAAKKSECFDHIILSTEDITIQHIASVFGGISISHRPAHLSRDNIHSIHVVIDCITNFLKFDGSDAVCMLLPTSPLRTAEDIKYAMSIFDCKKYDSLVGVCPSGSVMSSFRYINNDHLVPCVKTEYFENQRQEVDTVYKVNGAMYISTVKNIIDKKSFHIGKIQPYVMSEEKSVDINTEHDLKIAEALI